MCNSIPSTSMRFVIEGRFEVESCFVIIIICMPMPLLKHSSHPQFGSAGVWGEATCVVAGVIAATVVVIATVVALCPVGAERTATMAGGEATRQELDGHLGTGTTNGVMELEKLTPAVVGTLRKDIRRWRH